MFIREFVPSDLARVYQIEVESFSTPYELAILQQLYEIGAGFLVAVEDGEIVGYIIFWVKEEGIFKNIDIHRITLEVKSHNEAAVSFYQKFGFEIDRKVPNYYEDGSDAYVMLFSTNKISN